MVRVQIILYGQLSLMEEKRQNSKGEAVKINFNYSSDCLIYLIPLLLF